MDSMSHHVMSFSLVLLLLTGYCKGQDDFVVYDCDQVYPEGECHAHHCLTGELLFELRCPDQHFIIVTTSEVGYSQIYWSPTCPESGFCTSYTGEPSDSCNFQQSCIMSKYVTQLPICRVPTNYIDIYYTCVRIPGPSTEPSNTTEFEATTESPDTSPITNPTESNTSPRSTTTITQPSPVSTTPQSTITTSRNTPITSENARTISLSSSLPTRLTTLRSSAATNPPNEPTTSTTSKAPSSETSTSVTTLTSSPQETTTGGGPSSNSLSLGAIIGIAIGCAILLLLIILLIVLLFGGFRKPAKSTDPVDMHFPHIITQAQTNNGYSDLETILKPSIVIDEAEDDDIMREITLNLGKNFPYKTIETVSDRMSKEAGIRPVRQTDLLEIYSGFGTSENV